MWWRGVAARSVVQPLVPLRSAARWISTSRCLLQDAPPDVSIEALKGNIRPETYRALAEAPFHFTKMTDVQSRVLSLLPDLGHAGLVDTTIPLSDEGGRDLLVKARTGTGKTVAFLVPVIESRRRALEAASKRTWTDSFRKFLHETGEAALLESSAPSAQSRLQDLFRRRSVGALILSPTRELATQIANEARKLLAHQKMLNVHLLVGGNEKRVQRDEWRKRSRDIVVATPGRLMDLMEDEHFRAPLATTQAVVLDEADMLLELGFREDIQHIMKALPAPEKRSTMLFSATINRNIETIARATLHKNHRFIDCVPPGEDAVHTRIPQFVTGVSDPSQLYPHVLRVIARDQLVHGARSKVMVFCSTTKQTRTASRVFRDASAMLPFEQVTRVFEIHSEKDQSKRNKITQSFRGCTHAPSVLVTSDVSARGVDYPGVTQVIQVGIPSSPEIYVHRVGRTGRGNSDGRADLVLMDWEDAFVTWDLKDMPLERLTPGALADEVHTLAAQTDAAPAAPRRAGRTQRVARLENHCPVAPRLDDEALLAAVSGACAELDRELSRGVFTSLIGYYASRSQALRLHKGQLVEYVADLAHATTGLPERPRLSPYMQRQLGLHAASRVPERAPRAFSKRRERPRRRAP